MYLAAVLGRQSMTCRVPFCKLAVARQEGYNDSYNVKRVVAWNGGRLIAGVPINIFLFLYDQDLEHYRPELVPMAIL